MVCRESVFGHFDYLDSPATLKMIYIAIVSRLGTGWSHVSAGSAAQIARAFSISTTLSPSLARDWLSLRAEISRSLRPVTDG